MSKGRPTTGRVLYCPLVSYDKYVPRAPLKSEKRRDRQTDGRTPGRYITLSLDAASVKSLHCWPVAELTGEKCVVSSRYSHALSASNS